MSLRLWLPLNGNLINKGLEPGIKVTNNQNLVTFVNDGKLGGQCAQFDSTSKNCYLQTNYYTNFGTNNFSIAFWVKIDADNVPDNYTHIVSSKGYGASDSGVCVAYFKGSDSTNAVLKFRVSGQRAGCPIVNFSNKWIHFIAIRDNTVAENVRFFINGIATDSEAGSDHSMTVVNTGNTAFRIGIDTDKHYFPASMQIQDVRIYDHALSDKEAKELAKGLVLHYKLNDTYQQINANMLPDTNVSSLTKVQASYNRYFANKSASGWTATWKFIEDPPVAGIHYGVEYNITTAGTNHAVCWYDGGTIPIQTGKIYTVSCYVKRIEGTDIQLRFTYGSSPYYENDDSTHQTSITVINDNEWHQYSWTFTSKVSNKRVYAGTPLSIGKTIFCGWKLEEGDTATPWCETNFSQKATTKVQDLSGYNHDGIIVGDLTTKPQSPKYNVSTIFPTNSDYFYMPHITSTTAMTNEFTFASWIYRDYTDTTTRTFYLGLCQIYLHTNFSLRIQWTHASANLSYNNTNIWDSGPIIQPQMWTHIAYTFQNGIVRCYINGVKYKTSDRSDTGQFIRGTKGSPNASIGYTWIGGLSDLRTYATALSDEDIKELYETSVSIDNKSNIYSCQFEENDLNKISITNRGQLQMDAIEENSSTASFYKDTKEIKGQLIYEY